MASRCSGGKLDDIASGVTDQETRITQLLGKIAELEAEIERRDAVVIKMAEKYQLVEKDNFGDDLVEQAKPEDDDNSLAFMQPEEPKKD